MAVTSTPIYPQAIVNAAAQIVNATGSALVTLVTGGTNGTKIESLNVSSTDTSARDIQLWMTISAVNYLLGTVSIPANAGNVNNIVSVDILRNIQIPSLAYDNNGNKYLYVASGAVLSIAALTTVTSAKAIAALAQGGNF
jgi:hypothetical protein